MSFFSNLKPIQLAGLVVAAAAGYYFLIMSAEDESVPINNVPTPKPLPAKKEEVDKSKSAEAETKTVDLGLPKVGEGPELMEDYGKALSLFAGRADKAGFGAGYVDMYGSPILFIVDPEMIRKVLSHTVQHALWGGLEAASRAFFGKNVLFVLEGKQWKFLRSVIKFSFTKQDVSLMEQDLAIIAERFSSKLKLNEEVDMNVILGLYHLSSVGKSAFNFDLDCLSTENLGPNEISDSFEFFINELPRRSLNPDQSVLGNYEIDNDDNRKWNQAARLLRSTIKKVIDARLEEYDIKFSKKKKEIKVDVGGKSFKKGARKDLLDAMIFSTIEAFDAEKKGEDAEAELGKIESKIVHLDKTFLEEVVENITDNLVEMMFAGYNTNVGTIANCLHFLSINPEYMKKCQAEVDAFFDETGLDKFDAVKFSKEYKLDRFPNIQNAFYETLRLRPPAPLIARLLTKEYVGTAPNGEKVTLTPGYPLWIPVEYIQKHPDHWFEHDASEFIPDRFTLKKPFTMGSYVPFSFGPRDCIGKNFAIQEAVVALMFLLRRFDFKEGDGYQYQNFFNGFGYRPYDASQQKVCMRLIPVSRKK